MAELVSPDVAKRAEEILESLGVPVQSDGGCVGPDTWMASGEVLAVTSPIDGTEIGQVREVNAHDWEHIVQASVASFERWRMVPAPKRGEIVRQLGNALREHKDALGALVSLECGKILEEGKGEVQEMIDIADFAVGLSRQLYGLTMHSERPGHRMYEQYHPIGPVGVISAFNFPVAVWAWNAFIAMVCGDTVIWKPSRATPLTAVAVTHICNQVLREHDLSGILNLAVGPDDVVGEGMTADTRIPVVSATGSCRMGKIVGPKVQAKEQKIDYKVGKFPFGANGRALGAGEGDGFVKLIADKKSGEVLGVHIIGANASDLIAEATLGIEMGAFTDDLALTVHTHPTLAEAIMEAAEHAEGHAIHTMNR